MQQQKPPINISMSDEVRARLAYIQKHLGLTSRSGTVSLVVTQYYNDLLAQGHKIIRNNETV